MKKLLLTLITVLAIGGFTFAQDYYFDFNSGGFGDNAGVTAFVQINGEFVQETDHYSQIEVAAFVKVNGVEECRGRAFMTSYVEWGDPYPIVEMQVYYTLDKVNEPIIFKMHDHATGENYVGTPSIEMLSGNWYGDEIIMGYYDNAPYINFVPQPSAVDIEIGDGDTSTNSYLPTYEYYNYSLTQQIYNADEIGLAGTINSIAFHASGLSSRNLQVYLVYTTKNSFNGLNSWITPTLDDLVFTGNVSGDATSDLVTLRLDTPFEYDGVSNLCLIVDDNTGSYVDAVEKDVFTPSSGGSCSMYIFSDGTNYDALNPTNYEGTPLNVKNRLQFNITPSGSACRTPSNLSLTNATATSASLSWSNNSDANNWEVSYYQDGGTFVNTITVEESSCTLTGLTTNVECHAKVRNLCSDTEQSDWSRTLSFTPASSYTITVGANPVFGGTCTGGGEFSFGDTCTLTARANFGYHFSAWMKDGGIVGSYGEYEEYEGEYNHPTDYTFIVNGNANVEAIFEPDEFDTQLRTNPYEGGSATLYCQGDTVYSVHYNDTVTLVASSNPGYSFLSWTANVSFGRSVMELSTDSVYTFVIDSIFLDTILGYEDYEEFDYDDGFYKHQRSFIEEGGSFVFTANFQPECARPTRLTAIDICPDMATIRWTENGTSESWYIFYHSEEPTPAYVPYTSIEVSSIPFTITGLMSDTPYKVFVVPSCGVNDGIPNSIYISDTLEFTTLGSCPTPLHVRVDSITGTTALATWGNYSDSYLVKLGSLPFAKFEDFENSIPEDWDNTSDYAWMVVEGHMQSGNAGKPNSNSSILTTVDFPMDGTIEFDAECIGEGYYSIYDECSFSIDDTIKLSAGQDILGWNHYSYNVTAGEHTFKWSYSKDGNVDNANGDYFAVDNILMKAGDIVWNDPFAVDTSRYIFTGLTPNHGYGVSVQGICTDTITEWSEPYFFSTIGAESHLITVTANPTNGGTVTGGGTYNHGQEATLTATANTGYTFVNWTSNDSIVNTNASYTFVVTDTATYVANFQLNSYRVNVTANPNEGGSVTGGGTYNHGQQATLTATANTGYTFSNWTLNDSIVNTDASYTFTVTDTASYVANFQLNSYTVNVTANPTNGGTVTGGGTYNHGQQATLTATANTGYTFSNWTLNGEIVGSTNSINFTVTDTASYVANFNLNSYDISASANPSDGGSVTGADSYNHFQPCTLTATAYTGYTFSNWTENGEVVSTSASYSFTVEGPRTLVANFTLNSYDISATIVPATGGSVSGTGTYDHGSSCTLIATANDGYSFVNWTKNGVAISSNPRYHFTVTEAAAFVANFSINSYEITTSANPTAGGSVNGAGTYNYGTSCTLTATVNDGYSFVNWTKNGVAVSTNASYTFTVTEAAAFVANFSLNSYEITASANPANGGTITGAGTYNHSETCNLTATANEGYTFVNWTKDGQVVGYTPAFHFTVTEAANYVANFELNSYQITATASPAAGGSVTGAGTYDHFETCTLTATANTGYTFVNWTKNGEEVSTSASYTFTVTEAATYVANFSINSHMITASANPTAGGSVAGAGNYNYGSTCTLTATANTGYTFVNWTKNGHVVSTDASYSFMVTTTDSFVAHFQLSNYEIKAKTDPENTGDIEGIGFYNYGETCTLSVTPHDEYEFINWTLNGDIVSEAETFSFIVTEESYYVAHLRQVDGVVEQGGLMVSLFPNPAKSKLTIEASEPVNMLEIFTINGALVYRQNDCSDKVIIDVENYAVGTYMIRLTTDSTVEIRRFVKE